jgi:hypothetical protein
MKKRFIGWEEIKERLDKLPKGKYWGVPRGGQYLSAYLNPVDSPEEADYIIDDLIDSGATLDKYKALYPNKDFIALYDKRNGDTDWYVFPWELEDTDRDLKDTLLRLSQFLNIKIKIEDEL